MPSNANKNRSGRENFGYQPDNKRGYQTDKSGTVTKKEPPARTPKGGTSGKKEK